MKLLLDNGADAEVCNAEGETPRDLISDLPITSALRQLFDWFQGEPKPWKTLRIPEVEPQCGTKQMRISSKFRANIWFYWKHAAIPWLRRVRVFDLVYDKDKVQELENEYIEFLEKKTEGMTVPPIDRKDVWKWIHFPANNVCEPSVMPTFFGLAITY